MPNAVQSTAAHYFSPRRLGHVNLWVDNLARSEAFYSQVCGLTVEFTEPDLIATFLGTGHTPHDLGMIQKTNGVSRYGRNGLLQLPGTVGLNAGLNHMAWELENEAALVTAYRRLKEACIRTDMTVDHQVAHSVYMFDPDGNYNEFYCDTVKNWRSVLHGPMELITSDWDPLAAEGFLEGRYDDAPVLRTNLSAPIRPHRITHAALQTTQLKTMCEFYTVVAGLRVVSDQGDVVYLGGSLDDYDFSLVLVSADAPLYHHASFELSDAVTLSTVETALASKGVPITKTVDVPWKQSIYLRDPDGLLSEWFVRRDAPRHPRVHGGHALADVV
jgi:catechol 2,3-dioxygenase